MSESAWALYSTAQVLVRGTELVPRPVPVLSPNPFCNQRRRTAAFLGDSVEPLLKGARFSDHWAGRRLRRNREGRSSATAVQSHEKPGCPASSTRAQREEHISIFRRPARSPPWYRVSFPCHDIRRITHCEVGRPPLAIVEQAAERR